MEEAVVYDKKFIFFLCSIIVGAFLLTSGVCSKDKDFVNKDFVTINISTINHQNKPLVGAKIFINDVYTGISDSYGKLRVHSRVLLGSELRVKAFKKVAGQPLEAYKSVVVPAKTLKNQRLEFSLSAKLEIIRAIAAR